MNFELKRLFALIHVIIISLVFAACNVIEPLLVIEVPTNGTFDAFFELETRPAVLRRQRSTRRGIRLRILLMNNGISFSDTFIFWVTASTFVVQ